MRVGVLGLQGAVEPHVQRLRQLGVESRIVRRPEHLEGLAGMILPGGESSTMLKLLDRNELHQPLLEFASNHPVWGLCAGAILLAKEVENPRQESMGLMSVRAIRNAYGRQLDSFIDVLTPEQFDHWPESVEGVFIRAPKLTILDPSAVEVLFRWQNEPVMVRQGHLLAASFHPELSQNPALHRYFVDMIAAQI